jgi:hypothetical protein
MLSPQRKSCMIRANSTSAVAFGTSPQGHDGLVLPNNLGLLTTSVRWN